MQRSEQIRGARAFDSSLSLCRSPPNPMQGDNVRTTHDGPIIFLVMLLQSGKTARNEMCSSDRIRFCCVRFAGIGSASAGFSSESRSAI